MMSETTDGLASPDLWDISASWSVASIGAIDTGGTLGVLLEQLEFEQPESPAALPGEATAPSRDVGLLDLMGKDLLFWQLTEKGLGDLEAGRFDRSPDR